RPGGPCRRAPGGLVRARLHGRERLPRCRRRLDQAGRLRGRSPAGPVMHRPQRTYGRIKARTLKPRQAGLMETLLPHLAVPVEGEIDIDSLFAAPPEAARAPGGPGGALRDFGAGDNPGSSPEAGAVVLEIGFGGGE